MNLLMNFYLFHGHIVFMSTKLTKKVEISVFITVFLWIAYECDEIRQKSFYE